MDDLLVGPGRYVYSNGDIYQGDFSASKRHGKGAYHYKAVGCQLVGDWIEGSFVSGRWILKDGSIFQGRFEKGLKPSEGVHLFARSQRRPSHAACTSEVGMLMCKGRYTKDGIWEGEPASIGSVELMAKLMPV